MALGHNQRTCPLKSAGDGDMFTQRFNAYIIDEDTTGSTFNDPTEDEYLEQYQEWMDYMDEAVQERFEQNRNYFWKNRSLDQLQATKWINCLLICFIKDDPDPVEDDDFEGDFLTAEDDEDDNGTMDVLQNLFGNLSQH